MSESIMEVNFSALPECFQAVAIKRIEHEPEFAADYVRGHAAALEANVAFDQSMLAARKIIDIASDASLTNDDSTLSRINWEQQEEAANTNFIKAISRALRLLPALGVIPAYQAAAIAGSQKPETAETTIKLDTWLDDPNMLQTIRPKIGSMGYNALWRDNIHTHRMVYAIGREGICNIHNISRGTAEKIGTALAEDNPFDLKWLAAPEPNDMLVYYQRADQLSALVLERYIFNKKHPVYVGKRLDSVASMTIGEILSQDVDPEIKVAAHRFVAEFNKAKAALKKQ